jgi:polysaccharide biosynthesis/export protein
MRCVGTVSILAAVLSGCAVVPGLHIDEQAGGGFELIEVTPASMLDLLASKDQQSVPEIEPVSPTAAAQEYMIGPGDVLTVTVWEHPELTNPVGEFRDPVSAGRLVNADGTIFFPYVGLLKASGMTTGQVRDVIAERLAKVIRDPQVDVRVAAFRSKRVQVSGEVKLPGVVTLDDTPKGLLEVINERGGLSESSSRRRATLIRDGKSYSVDLFRLVSGSSPSSNPRVMPGDIVHVPNGSADQVFVLGEVSKQGPAILHEDRTTLTEVLARSGGLDGLRADDSGVLVFRDRDRSSASESQPPVVFRLDMSRPSGLLMAGQFELEPRDVVYVKATGFARYNSIIGQLLPTITALFQLDRLVDD